MKIAAWRRRAATSGRDYLRIDDGGTARYRLDRADELNAVPYAVLEQVGGAALRSRLEDAECVLRLGVAAQNHAAHLRAVLAQARLPARSPGRRASAAFGC